MLIIKHIFIMKDILALVNRYTGSALYIAKTWAIRKSVLVVALNMVKYTYLHEIAKAK